MSRFVVIIVMMAALHTPSAPMPVLELCRRKEEDVGFRAEVGVSSSTEVIVIVVVATEGFSSISSSSEYLS